MITMKSLGDIIAMVSSTLERTALQRWFRACFMPVPADVPVNSSFLRSCSERLAVVKHVICIIVDTTCVWFTSCHFTVRTPLSGSFMMPRCLLRYKLTTYEPVIEIVKYKIFNLYGHYLNWLIWKRNFLCLLSWYQFKIK